MNRFLTILLILCFFAVTAVYAKSKVLQIRVESAIGPATASYIKSGIEYAENNDFQALIVRLNTPGGLLDATRDIIQSFFNSKVPVIVYVAPGGSRAGSAGVFITLAANIAVMAPGTNIGAAHPVGLGGESDSSKVMYDKVTNDASAFIRSIALKRHRNVAWAERAVRESISASETEALKDSVINFICPNTDSLLRAINGIVVETSSGTITLNTANAEVVEHGMNWKEELLSILTNPNIAYLLLLLGIYGIFFELYNPGSIFPGVAGGISIVLAAYSLQMLPINYAGVALILLGIVMFIVEVKVTSYGILTIGGIVSFLLGSIMLIDSPFEFMRISMSVIITAAVVSAIFFIFIVSLGIKAQSRKRATGKEALVGEKAIAIEDIPVNSVGRVKVMGESWKAISEEKINAGEEVIVLGVDKMVLKVRKKQLMNLN